MTDGDKSIDDFSETVSTTIRQYVKDEDALQHIADVLDDMGDQAWKDGYEEGNDAIDCHYCQERSEGYDKGYDEGYKEAQETHLNELSKYMNEIMDRIDATKYFISADTYREIIEEINEYVQRAVDEFDAGNN